MGATRSTRLFICYRREDTLDFAGRLHDRLVARYGAANVIFDIDNVPIGVNFQKYLDGQIKQCSVLLALIGRNWVSASDGNGTRRLDDSRDFVRIELESALQRELPIVPVLVGGAEMPKESDLPPSLVPISYIHAADLASNSDFNAHFDRLVRAIDALVTVPAPLQPEKEKVEPVLSTGEQLLASLKRKLQKMRPEAEWVWRNSSGWWSVRERASSRVIVRAKPSRNLLRIRVRHNTARARVGVKVAYDSWIADGPEFQVSDERQLDRAFKHVRAEWG